MSIAAQVTDSDLWDDYLRAISIFNTCPCEIGARRVAHAYEVFVRGFCPEKATILLAETAVYWRGLENSLRVS